ncbi:kynureninase [Neorhizobium tomejilense]|uniref:kynureninase n=1 Tax=Neorhizobium tomejilense TaxID=2093828 RepID=UPI003ED01913
MGLTEKFAATRTKFDLPPGLIYLDGNSLGPMAFGSAERVLDVMKQQWGTQLIRAWNTSGWMDMPRRVGDRIGKLVGAPAGTVVTGDTLSIKVYQALASALELQGERKVVLTDSGNFPSDIYMAQGLIGMLGQGHRLRIVAPEEVEDAINQDVAVVMLTEVDYRTGRLHDMRRLTAKAHEAGALVIWDLAHSAGALPVHLACADVDFAVGCTYKYLNGGPGSPAFIYLAPRLVDRARPALSGWLGHETPFEFRQDYRPGAGIDRMRVGTPPIVALAALDAALDVWDGIALEDVRAMSIQLSERFIEEVERRCPDLTLLSPRDPQSRGSQVSFGHPEGYAIMQALIDRDVIGDFRAPEAIRFGFTPLYIGHEDVLGAVAILEDVMRKQLWLDPRYQKKAAVT